jgi:hypothetical protein
MGGTAGAGDQHLQPPAPRRSRRTRRAGPACGGRRRPCCSNGTSSASSVSQAWRIVSQSEREPMITPTSAFTGPIMTADGASSACDRRGTAAATAARHRCCARPGGFGRHRPRERRVEESELDGLDLAASPLHNLRGARLPLRRGRSAGDARRLDLADVVVQDRQLANAGAGQATWSASRRRRFVHGRSVRRSDADRLHIR